MRQATTILMFILIAVVVTNCKPLPENQHGTGDNVVCNPPYMRLGLGCCLDKDNNSICDSDQPDTQPGDPAHRASSLHLIGGTVNAQQVSAYKWSVTASPGQRITGQVVIGYENAWPGSAVMVAGYTPTWGDHEKSFVGLTPPQPGEGTMDAIIDVRAPSEPGTYYLIFGMKGEMQASNLFSMSNWGEGNDKWNDGNDVADWSSDAIAAAMRDGRAPASQLSGGMYRDWVVPATAIEIVVR